MTTTTPPMPAQTAFVVEQKRHLVKTLSRVDLVFLTVALIVGLDLIGQAASNGYEAFTWTFLIVLFFLLPYGLVMAEVGSAFPAEGGPYEWVKLALGRFAASVTAVLYWVTNPLWVGGSLAFIATEALSSGITEVSGGSAWDYAFKLGFIWVSISAAIISFRVGKWIPTLGAILKIALIAFFAGTVIVYGLTNGVEGIDVSKLKPTGAGLLAIAPLILFSFAGFEAPNGAAEEMKDPQRDVPSSILRSGLLAAVCYLIPIFLVLLVLPGETITGLGGFLDAVKESYSVYGSAAGTMYGITCALFILTLTNSSAAWMMCGDRVLAVAAADGGFFPGVGAFHPRLGTPLRANLMSGAVATVFMVAAVLLLSGGAADTFGVVLNIAISTTLLSYILIFPSAYLLRRKYPEIRRPFRLGRGNGLLLACVALSSSWIVLGSWTAVLPGTLNRLLLGDAYSFPEEWGVTQGEFFTFTLGTLAVLVAIGVLGYLAGAKVRRDDVPLVVGGAAGGRPAPVTPRDALSEGGPSDPAHGDASPQLELPAGDGSPR